MENDLRFPLIISVIIHLSVFLITSFQSKRIIYVNIPIDLFFYTTPAPADVIKPSIPEEKEIIIPKKPSEKKIEKKIEERKEEEKVKPAPEAPQRTLVPSSQISLESARFPYTYYTSLIVKKVSRNWQWSVEFGQLKTVIYFHIQKSGNIEDVEVKIRSGDKLFDQHALRAVKLAAPFPPLPAGYEEDRLGIYFEFAFKE